MLNVATVPRLAQANGLELTARRIAEGLYAGRHRSPCLGPATEFADHRPYLPGDDLRSIDWKAYGRCDHLLIRRYREERDLPLVLVMDTSASMAYGSPAKNSWAVLSAATLSLLAIDQSDRVRLFSGAASVAASSAEYGGPAGAQQILKLLDGLSFRGSSDLGEMMRQVSERLRRRTLVVLISDLLYAPDRLARPLAALCARGHDLAVLQVLDRSEMALPAAWGLSQLTDPEEQVQTLTCDAAIAKSSYDQAMNAHLGACRRLVAACRGDHILAVTDQGVADVLGGWLHRRRSR